MSPVENRPKRLDLLSARRLPGRTELVILARRDGSVVERLTLLRYAGHYRTDAVHAFAVKDSEGRFAVRSEAELGLTCDSPFESVAASDYSAPKTSDDEAAA